MGGFLATIKSAFSFIKSAVASGISAAETALSFVKSGVALAETEIASEMSAIEAAKFGWERIKGIDWFAKITERFGMSTNMDYAQKYVMSMHIHGINVVTGTNVNTWVTVESNTELTKWEWMQTAKTMASAWVTTEPVSISYVSEWEYYVKE